MYIDSLITQAYNSDDNAEWAVYRQDVDAPNPSLESQEDIDFESSSESAGDMIPMPQNRKQKQEMKAKPQKIVKESLVLHGFNMEMFRAYPHLLKDGDVPCFLLDLKLEAQIKNIKPMVSVRLAKEFKEKVLFPTI
jgi:hypothetical protein